MDESWFLSALIGAGIALVLRRLSRLERRLNRLSRLDAKVDALLKNAGIIFNEVQDVPAGVREALDQGQRIEAIKRYRQATGTDLKSAKEAIDEIRRRRAAES